MIGNVNYFDACYAALKINNANTTEIIQRSNQLQHRCTITRWKPKFARDFDQTQKGIACGLAILYRNCATSRLNSNALPINRLKFPGKKATRRGSVRCFLLVLHHPPRYFTRDTRSKSPGIGLQRCSDRRGNLFCGISMAERRETGGGWRIGRFRSRRIACEPGNGLWFLRGAKTR